MCLGVDACGGRAAGLAWERSDFYHSVMVVLELVRWALNRARSARTVYFLHAVLPSLICVLGSALTLAAEPGRHSILVLDQADTRSPFYSAIFAGLRATATANSAAPVSIFIESLDLSRFNGPLYEASLKAHLRSKYADHHIGVIVVVGATALDLVLRSREELWPQVPVVFCMVDEPTVARLSLSPDVTGSVVRLRFADMMAVARTLVPKLKRIALVGGPWEKQTVYGHFKEEIPAATAGLEVIDLVGLPLADVRRRLASLPPETAIFYTSMETDGAGTSLRAVEALARFADVAKGPIIGTAETFIGHGAAGGFVMTPSAIGDSAARLALRILNGEEPSQIPITPVDAVRPIFDWRQMQRWGIRESRLPPASEIRFRKPSVWEDYHWPITAIAGVIAVQTLLIIGLVYQRRRRHEAEVEARQRLAELAQMNRQATAGQLSASIAHELNQPLGAILNNVEAATLILDSPSPRLHEIRAILDDIKRDDKRASEVIMPLRRFLIRGAVEAREVDLNEVVRDVFAILSAQAAAQDVKLSSTIGEQRLRVSGDRVQLEQVILNLVVNGIEAVSGTANGTREVVCRTWAADSLALVSVRDSGPGIPPEHLDHLFKPFFTTKADGMGMGLCIAQTIIEAHGGKLSAETRPNGAVLHISLPLAKRRRR